jgi:hypothetical protein
MIVFGNSRFLVPREYGRAGQPVIHDDGRAVEQLRQQLGAPHPRPLERRP